MSEVWSGIFGICGVLVGVFGNELLRQKRRIESYSTHVFEIRLTKYEELTALMLAAYHIASEVMDNCQYSIDERHALISSAIFPIAEFTDKNDLYLNSDISAHCIATFMGAEDVCGIQDANEKERAKQDIRNMYKSARQMIREDSGVAEIEKLFQKITKPKLSGPVIERIRYLREHPEGLTNVSEHNVLKNTGSK